MCHAYLKEILYNIEMTHLCAKLLLCFIIINKCAKKLRLTPRKNKVGII